MDGGFGFAKGKRWTPVITKGPGDNGGVRELIGPAARAGVIIAAANAADTPAGNLEARRAVLDHQSVMACKPRGKGWAIP
jgi:hypothetical protein